VEIDKNTRVIKNITFIKDDSFLDEGQFRK